MKADFRRATEREIGVLCNGCGPQNMPWLRPFIPQFVFHHAGNEHDWDYHVGGGYEEYWRANFRFLADCLRAIADYTPFHSILLHIGAAVLYYLCVKFGGKLSFHWGPPRSHEEMQALALSLEVKAVEASLDKEK